MTAEVVVLNATFAVHQLKSTDLIPPQVFRTPYYWIGRTGGFLSLICDASLELESVDTTRGWVCLHIMTGDPVLPELAQNLRSTGVAFVPLPSGDGAYGLVPENQLAKVRGQLSAAGYQIDSPEKAGSA